MRHVIVIIALVTVVLMMSPAHANYLTVSKLGEGSVSPSLGSHYYAWYTKVTVTATPATGWVFSRWEGDFAGNARSFSYRSTSDKWSCAVFVPATTGTSTNALVEYAGRIEPNSGYSVYSTSSETGYDLEKIALTSQNWRSTSEVDRTLWQHDLAVVKPWFHGDEVLYFIDGGDNPVSYPDPEETFATAAIGLGSCFASIRQVPNQPLHFADEADPNHYWRYEDAILAYSLDKCLDTGDWTWPAHVAMVKAAIRGMDVTQRRIKTADQFIVMGASKRGWTTWLTTAIDPRVVAVIPIVIDVFNLELQTEHHWECYGSYSEAIHDYVDFDLFCRAESDLRAPDMKKIVDPYTFISKYTMPMLIPNATGDQFFLPDSSRYYLDDLPSDDVSLRYFANKDHYMTGVLEDSDVVWALFSWGYNFVYGYDNPYIDWTVDGNGAITVSVSKTPDSVKLWQATNPTARDFRLQTIGAAYTSTELTAQGNGTYIGYCPPPAQGFTAYFVEADLGAQTFTTRIYVTPDIEPYDDLGCWAVD